MRSASPVSRHTPRSISDSTLRAQPSASALRSKVRTRKRTPCRGRRIIALQVPAAFLVNVVIFVPKCVLIQIQDTLKAAWILAFRRHELSLHTAGVTSSPLVPPTICNQQGRLSPAFLALWTLY